MRMRSPPLPLTGDELKHIVFIIFKLTFYSEFKASTVAAASADPFPCRRRCHFLPFFRNSE